MIDVHCHIDNLDVFSKYFIDGIVSGIISDTKGKSEDSELVHFLVASKLSDKTGEKMIQQMDRAGVDKAVLLIIDFFYEEDPDNQLIEKIHHFHYRLQQTYPDRFIVFSGIDPRRGSAGIRLFKKYIDEYKFQGLKLYPPCGYEIDDECLQPYYDLCSKYKLPVLIHTGPSLDSMYLSKKYPRTIESMAEKYKDVNFILAHSGILYFDSGLALAEKYPNIYLDISGFQKNSSDTLTFQRKLRILFEKIPTKVLYGSDWPLYNFNVSQKKWIDFVKQNSGLTPEQYRALMDDNARKLLMV